MKQVFLSIIFLLMPLMANADYKMIDGIYYFITPEDKVAEVIGNPNNYSGDIVIPESVPYDGVDYSVTKIGSEAFGGCSGLKSIIIPNSVTSVGKYAFQYCTGLTSITIGNSVTSIGEEAFLGCSSLTSVHISDLEAWCKISFGGINCVSNPLSNAHHLFLNGEEIKDLVIPDGVTSIGKYAFQYCTGLTSITIGNSVTKIGSEAFGGCSGLTSIIIPNSVTSIGDYAFSGCKITTVDIPNSVISIGEGAFNGLDGLTSVTIGNSVTSIGNYAFFGCSGLTSIIIPNSVTSIGNGAFGNCSGLTSVTIGNSVSSIGNYAFNSCTELKNVYCYAENVPSTKTDAFDGSFIENVILHVPDASVANYKSIVPWKSFGSIVGLNGESLPKCATPVINYNNGKITFTCETEGVEFVSELTNADANKNYTNEISVSGKYFIKVYATKEGYQDSDTATLEFQLSGSSSVEPGGTTEESKKGDLNGDNEVNAADVVTLVNIIASEASGGDNPPVSGDDSEVTSKISAYYAGGVISKVNNTIQSGSQIMWGFKNGSSASVTLIGAVLINGATGSESNNLLSESVEVAAGESKGYTTTIGVLGIQEPKIRFTYKYNQKEYSVEAAYKDIDGI